MSKRNPNEAEMIAAWKQMEEGRKAEDVAQKVDVSEHAIHAKKAKYSGEVLALISHHDSSDGVGGPALRIGERGLVAPASRRQFLYSCRGAKPPAGRRRYQTCTSGSPLHEIRIQAASAVRNPG